MLPRSAGALVLTTLLASCLAGFPCPAQTPAQTSLPAAARYRFGDDPDGKLGWADPKFDDSSWPAAQRTRWPLPPVNSDWVMWVRVRVPVRWNAAGPLALRLLNPGDPEADELFVNGVRVGQQGSLPPHAGLSAYNSDAVFDLPSGAAKAGSIAVVAFRAWYPPVKPRRMHTSSTANFEIDESRNLHLASHANRVSALLAEGPDLALNLIIGILGVALLVFWHWTGGRELQLCSWMLISMTTAGVVTDLSSVGALAIPWWASSVTSVALIAITMTLTLEFMWRIYGLRAASIKRLARATVVIFNGAFLITHMATAPFPIASWSLLVLTPSLVAFNSIQAPINLWMLFVRRKNRLIAAAIASISITALLDWFGITTGHSIGPFYVRYFALSFFLCDLALFVMLSQRAWTEWRARDELRMEFEAAREVQQQLVAPAVDVPGFRIESVYAPAKQVGGDFFRVLPAADSGLLVVVGDVSGKGLRAAMTVSAIVGALRTMPPASPADLLVALNRGLAGQLRGGFVTCCVARITRDGEVTIANAGHLSPYVNGAEVPLAAGLPLGIDPECIYEESHILLRPAESFMFLSDGVVEARNATGELFGFDRTLRISNSGAEAIAQAAIDFGQDDDITVLTLTRTAVHDLSTAKLPAPALSPSLA